MKMNRRLIHVWTGIPLKEEDMGEVRIKVKLVNSGDEANARRGTIAPDAMVS